MKTIKIPGIITDSRGRVLALPINYPELKQQLLPFMYGNYVHSNIVRTLDAELTTQYLQQIQAEGKYKVIL